jgi:hypothetical protein
LDQLFEPGVVPDDHDGPGGLPPRLQYQQDVGGASQIEAPVQHDLAHITSRLGHRLRCELRPHRVGADDHIG